MNTVQAKESEDVFNNQRPPEVLKVTFDVFCLWICVQISAYYRSSEGQVRFFFLVIHFFDLLLIVFSRVFMTYDLVGKEILNNIYFHCVCV